MLFGMPKIAKPLSAVAVNRLNSPGWHAVGGVAGLLLQIRNPTQEGAQPPRSWILRTRVGADRQILGLGSYPQVSLAEAREQAKRLLTDARQGVNLRLRKKQIRSAQIDQAGRAKTFIECATAYLDAHASDYSNDKHRKQWAATLITYAYPVIGSILVADIGKRHIMEVLLQECTDRAGAQDTRLWYAKTQTATRLLGRIKSVLDYATVNEYRTGVNPATWTGYLNTQLPAPKTLSPVRHHPAVAYQDISDFMVHLRRNQSMSANALEFLILTAVRSGSVRAAEWSEIDFENKLWSIPAAHTKTRQEMRVPLSDQAIALFKRLPHFIGDTKIFASTRGKSLSDMALSQLMRGMRERGELSVDAVPHGFRSTFRTWSAEQTNYADEIRKAASGHAVGDAVKASYQRTDLLEKRRRLMADWANFLDQPSRQTIKRATPSRTIR